MFPSSILGPATAHQRNTLAGHRESTAETPAGAHQYRGCLTSRRKLPRPAPPPYFSHSSQTDFPLLAQIPPAPLVFPPASLPSNAPPREISAHDFAERFWIPY